MNSTAIALAASAQHTADIAGCKQTISSFNPDGASVAAMQAYAKCVELIHPEDATDLARLFIKITILFFFGGTIWGFIRIRLTGEDLFYSTMMALIFGFTVGCVPPILVLIGYAAKFLFS